MSLSTNYISIIGGRMCKMKWQPSYLLEKKPLPQIADMEYNKKVAVLTSYSLLVSYCIFTTKENGNWFVGFSSS